MTPVPNDCTLFYRCDIQGNLYSQACASGLYFDGGMKQCVWPYQTNCVSSTIISTTTTTTTTAIATTTTFNSGNKNKFNS